MKIVKGEHEIIVEPIGNGLECTSEPICNPGDDLCPGDTTDTDSDSTEPDHTHEDFRVVVDECPRDLADATERAVEATHRADSCEIDFELQKQMFLQCAGADPVDGSICMDLDWYDVSGADCKWYEDFDMCQYNYLHIWANEETNVDAYQACCACGGGEWHEDLTKTFF
eukprot:UN06777